MGELQAIRQRVAAAVSWQNMASGFVPEPRMLPIRFDDAEWLLAEVERLRGENEELRNEVERLEADRPTSL